MTVERAAESGRERTYAWKYRSLAYRLAKNYGLRPFVGWRTTRQALGDAWTELRAVRAGDRRPSSWFGEGRDVAVNVARGAVDGWLARRRDRTAARNPNGVSSRDDRAVHVHDWR
jgi:hypothetical protein